MPQQIIPISLGFVNCYLIHTETGFILVDTGISAQRSRLEKALTAAGCRPGNLNLILITHNDPDHSANAAYLGKTYSAPVGMHPLEVWPKTQRKPKADRMTFLFRLVIGMGKILPSSASSGTLQPDLPVDESFDLAAYGADARILHIPGHTKGSLGILTGAGELICGDFFTNFTRPDCPYVDDLQEYSASLEKIKSAGVKLIYPGHGKPFKPVP